MQLQRITKHTKPVDRSERWHVIDADSERLGRLATKVASLLQGKHRADYSRHQLNEDFVVVINASKVGVSGNKMSQKVYYRHSGYLGSLRTRTLEEMLDRFPERVIELAVKGMLPRNRLGRKMLRRLKVYAGGTHPHEAQVRMGMGKPKQAPAAVTTTRRGRRSAAAPVEEAVVASAEPVVEEAPVEEAAVASAEPAAAASVEEAVITSAEPVAEEAPVEEAVVASAEPVVEEAPVEEAAVASAEPVVEEAPVEEAAVASEEPAVDESPSEEAAATSEEPAVDESPSEEAEAEEKPERKGESK